MGLDDLRAFLRRHRRIGIDTSIFIYQLEAHPRYDSLTEVVFSWLEASSHSAQAKEVAELGAHKKSIDAVAFSLDGQLLASMAADGSLAVWNTAARQLRYVLQAPQNNSPSITLLHFSPQGESLAVGQLDGVVQLWDLAQQKRTDLIAAFPGRSAQRLERIDSLAFSHNGHLLAAAGSENRQVAMWEVPSHKSRPPLMPAN